MQSRRQHRSQREMINLSNIPQLWLLLEALMDTSMSSVMYFPIVYIVIFLFKILTHLSSFSFILCRKKQRLKYCIVCTDKHVHVQCSQSKGSVIMAYSVHRLSGNHNYQIHHSGKMGSVATVPTSLLAINRTRRTTLIYKASSIALVCR